MGFNLLIKCNHHVKTLLELFTSGRWEKLHMKMIYHGHHHQSIFPHILGQLHETYFAILVFLRLNPWIGCASSFLSSLFSSMSFSVYQFSFERTSTCIKKLFVLDYCWPILDMSWPSQISILIYHLLMLPFNTHKCNRFLLCLF